MVNTERVCWGGTGIGRDKSMGTGSDGHWHRADLGWMRAWQEQNRGHSSKCFGSITLGW